MKYKPLPIGIENFEKMIEQKYYYVDKTLLIQKLLDYRAEATLFTRPRRFGKSLNLSMLQCFFEKTEKEKENYRVIANNEAEQKMMLSSIKFLTRCLEKAYEEKVIILLDEYDVPLENAYFKGFYEEMVGFIRGILSAVLKTNESLFMGIMTGCL